MIDFTQTYIDNLDDNHNEIGKVSQLPTYFLLLFLRLAKDFFYILVGFIVSQGCCCLNVNFHSKKGQLTLPGQG